MRGKSFARSCMKFFAVTLLMVLLVFPAEAVSGIEVQQKDLQEVEDDIAGWVRNNKRQQGVHVLASGDQKHVLIAWGEKPTGGYAVNVDDIGPVDEDSLRIDVELIAPGDDDIVTQAITYPHALLCVDGEVDSVQVNFYGESWRQDWRQEIEEESEDFIHIDPVLLPDEIAPNPIVLRGMTRVLDEDIELIFEDGHYHLAEVELDLLKKEDADWSEFELALFYSEPSNPVGTFYAAYQDDEEGRIESEPVSVNFNEASAGLADVSGHWAETPIRRAVTAGIVRGHPDGNFKPEDRVTRAEFLTMLVSAELEGKTPDIEGDPIFPDVEGHWSEPYVLWAQSEGLIPEEGQEFEDELMPDTNMTREEMALVAAHAAGLSPGDYDEGQFSDEDEITEALRPWVAEAAEKRLLLGYDDGTFQPGRELSRAEAVTVIWRIMDAR